MLLRASRTASQLTKEAIVGGVVGAGKKILGVIGRHPWASLGVGATGIMAAPEVSRTVQRSNVGLSRPWLQAANAGQVPHVPKF